MKRWFCSLMVVGLLTVVLCGCANSTKSEGDGTEQQTEEAVVTVDCLEFLTNVWNAMDENQRFPAAGGDFQEENQKMDEPGKFGLEDAENVDNMLAFPASDIAKVDQAASLMHMMNANTFTCGAFHVVDSSEMNALADAVRENINKRQWMCGMPDKYVIATDGSNLVVMFGNQELIDDFKGKMEAQFSNVKIIYDAPISQ